MQAVQMSVYSPKLNVDINDISTPKIKDNQLLIKVMVAGVDPHIVLALTGKVKLFGRYDFPKTLGNELSGIVVEVGSQVNKFNAGDYVYTMPPLDDMGAFAEYIAVDADYVAQMPENLSFAQAAAVPLSGLTIMQILQMVKPKAGERLFISGGTGGFGQVAVPYAISKGLQVTVSGSKPSREIAEKLNAGFIDYMSTDYDQHEHIYDYVIDTRGVETVRKHLKLLKPGGRMISLNGGPNKRFAQRNQNFSYSRKILFSLIGFVLDNLAQLSKVQYDFLYVEANGEQLKQVTKFIEQTHFEPIIDSEYSFLQVNEAIKKITTQQSQGKVLLNLENTY
ncbi:NADP-dependent oxidoreductase [Leuconostoc gelidum]|uniref:NADP-dependent oxidoreductase n=1 Tax=Leuconostoc gelidum subsp. gelidum TaxID=1607839 RepID=A0ABS7V591_LEUGE|nr:NADP-dependent oxidoreductase [Leuconostoc gelidum]MBZ5963600.1 NADP-dependent oxidoreductase [Leuconostoc gelidum subsp. gelidum]MBZ5987057.1 NADP-dependent oxidoreductase [Leuconostoc gelidum subsp. gelidum]MBZ6000254.1 NADP-dependent oxidoreductase [Leuconostoc gelidum subsp. gelidum]